MANYQSSYTGAQIDTAIAKVNQLQMALGQLANVDARLFTAEQNINNLQNNKQNNLSVSSTTVTQNGLTALFNKYGRVVTMTINGGTTSTALASGAAVIAIPSEYRPLTQCEMENTWTGNNRIVVWGGGTDICTTGALSAGTYIRCSGTWISST